MKWLFLGMLLVNLLVFIWGIGYYNTPKQLQPLDISNLKITDLKLINERNNNQKNIHRPSNPDKVTDEWLIIENEKDLIQTNKISQNKSSESCIQIGFFKKEQNIDKVASVLKSLGVIPEIKHNTHKEKLGFWIIYPAQKTMDKSIELMDKVRSKGYDNAFLFTDGENKGAISLGMFSNFKNASNHLQKLIKKEIPATIVPRNKETKEYFIEYQQSNEDSIPPEIWNIIQSDYPHIKKSKINCKN